MDQVSGVAVGAVGVGLVFLFSGLKGSSVLVTMQELVQGKKPAFNQTNPIGTPAASSTAAGSQGAAPATAGTGQGKTVCASQFGGPGDPGTGSHGYHGDNLSGTMAYAELGNGQALGNLPYRQKARLTYKGKTVVAEKLDIGGGGGGCGGRQRAVDLWWETARALGFNGLDVIEFEVI